MRPIPLSLKNKISANPFMQKCIFPECYDWPEWEHAWIYGGAQINEQWAIVPVCAFHHRGDGLNKYFNQWVALRRATDMDLAKYPKKNWAQERSKLDEMFTHLDIKQILAIDSY